MITFRGTGKKRTENTKYDLNDVLFYHIIFWFTNGSPMHFKCFKSATGINLTHKNRYKHFCVLFFCYLPLGITPPILNMGIMLTGSANRPATNLAYHEHPGQFLMGSKWFTLNN